MLNRILELLADGQFHSGEELGETLGVSRAAVWKQLKKLDELNIPYSSVKGKGYRLQDAIELLDKERIQAALTQRLDILEVLLDVGSTNTYLFERASDHMGKRYAVLAEKQVGGRGRRGRQWVSPFGKNIYLSLLVSFAGGMAALEGLSLMTAIAVEKALAKLGIEGIGLKWPNDVYADGKKLAGILLEVTGEYSSHCQVVIGIGLNLALSSSDAESIEQPWAELRTLKPGLSRNDVAATILDELLLLVDEFQRNGFAPYQQYWSERDIYHQQEVRIISAANEKRGKVKGVNRKGELMLHTEHGIDIINAGEISVRPVN
jgi:BirA family biotin operon repressor/biotin-[acetyl-CoA-carboxylase] ligase